VTSGFVRSHRAIGMAELVFIMDGDSDVRRIARQCLEEAGHSVRTFSTAIDLQEVQTYSPSLMLIAATLPDGKGIELCRQIRRNPTSGSTAVILLTDGSSEEQNCAALEAGADNFLAKPFTPRELRARVEAALRHVVRHSAWPADIVINHGAMTLSVRGNEVATTALEFRLVNYLARHRGHAFTRDMLLDAVWGDTHFVTPRTVDACIRRVREKIEPDMTRPTYLKTVRGIGYRFDAVAFWPSSGETCNCLACAPPNGRTAPTGSLRLVRKRAVS
jgi:DNA-binding response OmpR family regulator